ncbi:recombinase RecT [Mycobacterium branderi]|uniref:recombinase RecT n=1 Tax=Mycobacterium branderi TaxID=43348 RepID=UPI0013D3E053
MADQASTELAIAGGQTGFTETQVAALRQIGIEDATDADLQVFFHHCRRTGLDPFARQIYMIGRETDVNVRVQLDNGNTRIEKQRVMKYTIQTGIEGYRVIGKRAARREGVVVSNDDPLWCGKDGVWRDFWPKSEGKPVAAKYTIRVDGAPNTATVMFEEFAQYTKNGELNSMWNKMSANQLAKCAEAQAWKKAFPADFSDIILEGTDQGQVIDSDGAPVRVPSQRRGVDGLRAALGADDAAPGQDGGNDASQDAEPSSGATLPPDSRDQDQTGMSDVARRKWLNRMFALLSEGDCNDRQDQLIVIAALAGLPVGEIEHRDAISDDELRAVVNQMNAWNKAGVLGQQITEILNAATLAAEEDTTTEGNADA